MSYRHFIARLKGTSPLALIVEHYKQCIFSFICPTLEYGDIIWNNCPLYYKDKVEKVNLEAARIVTGATKLVSLQALYKETGWENLEARREKHKLIQFFKIINGLTPEYLQQLVPPSAFPTSFP